MSYPYHVQRARSDHEFGQLGEWFDFDANGLFVSKMVFPHPVPKTTIFSPVSTDGEVDTSESVHGDIINGMEMQDGRVRNHESISAAIRSEFRDFIGKGDSVQIHSETPTRESIMNITDRSERLAAIQANPQLFHD